MPDYIRGPGFPRKSDGADGKSAVDQLQARITPNDDDTMESMLEYLGMAKGDECPFDPDLQLINVDSGPSKDGQFMIYDLTYALKGLRPIIDTAVPVIECQGGAAGRAIELIDNYRIWWNHALVVNIDDPPDSEDLASMLDDEDYYKSSEVPTTLEGRAMWIKGDTPVGWKIYSKSYDRTKNGLQEYQIPSFTFNEYYLFSTFEQAVSLANNLNWIFTPNFITETPDLEDIFFGEFLITGTVIGTESKAFSVRKQYQYSPWVVDDVGEKVPDPYSEGNYLGGFDHDIFRHY